VFARGQRQPTCDADSLLPALVLRRLAAPAAAQLLHRLLLPLLLLLLRRLRRRCLWLRLRLAFCRLIRAAARQRDLRSCFAVRSGQHG
jgi:hypothetical protein